MFLYPWSTLYLSWDSVLSVFVEPEFRICSNTQTCVWNWADPSPKPFDISDSLNVPLLRHFRSTGTNQLIVYGQTYNKYQLTDCVWTDIKQETALWLSMWMPGLSQDYYTKQMLNSVYPDLTKEHLGQVRHSCQSYTGPQQLETDVGD